MTPSCSSWSARKAAPRAATTARRRCGRSPRLRLTCKGGHYLGLGRWRSLHAALCRARLGRGRACLPQIFRHTANRAWVRGPCSGCACICHAACKVFPMCTGFCEACCRSRCRVQAQLKHPQVALRTSAFNNVQGRTRAHTCASKRSWARAQQCGARRVRQRSSRRSPPHVGGRRGERPTRRGPVVGPGCVAVQMTHHEQDDRVVRDGDVAKGHVGCSETCADLSAHSDLRARQPPARVRLPQPAGSAGCMQNA